MATTLGPVQLAGDFKNLYQNSGLVEAIPSWGILQDRYKFEEAESLGQYYIFGVTLQKEHGATYAPSSGTSSGPQILNASVAGYVAQVQVQGFSIYMRSRLSYDAAAKASRAGKKAFAQAYGAVLKNLKESHQYRLELSLLYGTYGIGVVSSVVGQVVTVQTPYWATGIWAAGMQNCPLDIWSTSAASAVVHASGVVISSVNIAAKQLTLTGTLTSVVAGDVLYFMGARTSSGWNECPGIYAILNNGTVLFNVDASLYDAWKAQQYPVGGNWSMTGILQGSALGLSYGLEKGLALGAPEKFAQLGIDEASLRRYVSDSDLKNTKRGVKGVEFTLGPVDIEVMAHPFVWQGFPFIIPDEHVHRVGATDITMGMPGSDEPMEVHVTDTTALEIRSMSDQGIYLERPAHGVQFTGVT